MTSGFLLVSLIKAENARIARLNISVGGAVTGEGVANRWLAKPGGGGNGVFGVFMVFFGR